MKEIWWEAEGFSDVVTKTGDSIRRRESVLFEAVDDRGAAFAEAVYTLGLKGVEHYSNEARSLRVVVGRIVPRTELPITYYMGVLKENFEKKGLVDCANELALYAQHELPEIHKVAEELLEEVVDSITQDHSPSDLPAPLRSALEWFEQDAPDSEPFNYFCGRLDKWKEDNRE